MIKMLSLLRMAEFGQQQSLAKLVAGGLSLYITIGDTLFLGKEEKIIRWGDTRKKGMRRFIILNGVLGYGLVMALSSQLGMWCVSSSFNPWVSVPIALVLFPLSGLFVGWIQWRSAERIYKERTETGSILSN